MSSAAALLDRRPEGVEQGEGRGAQEHPDHPADIAGQAGQVVDQELLLHHSVWARNGSTEKRNAFASQLRYCKAQCTYFLGEAM